MPSKNTTRMFFVFEDLSRLMLDVDDRRLVGEVKEKVRQVLLLGADEAVTGCEHRERRILSLSYAGAVLEDSWRFADLGIPSGAQVRLIFCQVFKRKRFLFGVAKYCSGCSGLQLTLHYDIPKKFSKN